MGGCGPFRAPLGALGNQALSISQSDVYLGLFNVSYRELTKVGAGVGDTSCHVKLPTIKTYIPQFTVS